MNVVLLNDLYIKEKEIIDLRNELNELDHNLAYFSCNAISDEDTISRIKDADILIIDNYKISNEVLEQATHLKYIIVAFTGYDHLDISYCKSRNISVSNCSGYASNAVAELIVGLIIAHKRKLLFFDNQTRNNLDKNNILGEEVNNNVIGFVGFGKIARQTYTLLKPFGVKFLAYSHNEIKDKPLDVEQVDFNYLLDNSSIISINTPLNKETEGMFNLDSFKRMNKEAILINTGRGPIIDRNSLIYALKNKLIAGACLDVFDKEPPINDEELCSLNNVILLPHVGYFTKEAMLKRFDIVKENLFSYIEDNIVLNKII